MPISLNCYVRSQQLHWTSTPSSHLCALGISAPTSASGVTSIDMHKCNSNRTYPVQPNQIKLIDSSTELERSLLVMFGTLLLPITVGSLNS